MTISKSLTAIVAVTCLLIGATAEAQRVTKPIALTEAQIDKELAAVLDKGRKMKDLQRLQRIGTKIKSTGRCQAHWADVKNSYESLERLNSRYQRKRVDANYRHQFSTLSAANESSRNHYYGCFTDMLSKRHRWNERGIVNYQTFEAMFTNLATELRGHTPTSLKNRADALYAQKQKLQRRNTAPVARLDSIAGQVTVSRNGRPIILKAGASILPGDSFSNGPNSRVTLGVTEVVGKRRRGPFLFIIGPKTSATITSDSVTQFSNHRSKGNIKFGIDLEGGAVRIHNLGAGLASQYVIRTGDFYTHTAASDAVVSYYPRRSIINVKLQGGGADIDDGNRTLVSLQPPSQVTIRRGVMQTARELPFKEWVAAVRAAGETKEPPPSLLPGGGKDVNRRNQARTAVDRMLQAMNRADANGLLTATTGQAQRDMRNSLRIQTCVMYFDALADPSNGVTIALLAQPTDFAAFRPRLLLMVVLDAMTQCIS